MSSEFLNIFFKNKKRADKMSPKKVSLILLLVAPLLYVGLTANENLTESVQSKEQEPISVATQAKKNTPPPMIALPLANANSLLSMEVDSTTQTYEPNGAIARIRAIQEKNALHNATLEDYDNYNRYPSNNVSIKDDEQDPLIKRYEIDERTTLSEDKMAALTIWSDKKFYQRGDQVTLFAKLHDINGVPVPSQFSAQLIYSEKESIQQFDLSDADGDGIHQMNFIADKLNEKTLAAGTYKLLVVNTYDQVADAAVFILSDPTAYLTGNYRDAVTKEGNLKIEAEIDVSANDRFYFQASLYTELGDPIGVTQLTSSFDKGRHWVPLEFYGLMVHDALVDGPYLLKNIALARVTMPMQRAPLTHPEYFTQAYQRAQFSSVRHDQLATLN